MDDNEWLDRENRRAGTRRWRAWWALKNRTFFWRSRLRGYVKRAPGVWIVCVAWVALVALLKPGVPWNAIFGAFVTLCVFFVVDTAGQAAKAAQAREAFVREQWEEHYATLQDSVPILATQIVEDHMEALGYRRKPVLLMGDVAYDAETGDPMDMRDPTKMWEKI